ncbi:MAG: M28 family peptidase [Planctomycetes bacterium]|nr:M28 family peptidase [Planctomycetota bacterium]
MFRIQTIVLIVLSLAAGSRCQQSAPAPKLVADRAQLAEVLRYLAADELEGRDTPSAGLETAIDWSIERLRDRGIQPGIGDSYEFHYELPGWTLAAADCRLAITVGGKSRELEPGREFRLLECGAAYDCDAETAARLGEAEALGRGLSSRSRLERPVLVSVTEKSKLWQRGETLRGLERGHDRGAPVLLVREDLLPREKVMVRIAIPEAKHSKVSLRNVVGLLKGSSRPDEYVMLSAHIDHIGVGLPRGRDKNDRIYNGANDDASGCAAVLELARLYGGLEPGKRPARSLLFVLFSAEEKGLRGSEAMASASPWPLDRLVAQLNIEMLGRPEKGKSGACWVTGREQSDFEEILGPALKRAGVELGRFEQEAMLYRASDNWPYARRGVVAHSISASGLRGIDYHETSDEFERIELDHMTRIVTGIAAGAWDFADREEAPKQRR